MPRVVQWLNENAYRAYPLVEDSDRTCTGHVVPDDLLLDFQLLDFDAPEVSTRLVSVSVLGTLIDLVFTYGAVTRTITVSAMAEQKSPSNYGTGEDYRITATFGPGLTDVLAWGDGTYTLTTPAQVEPALLNFENKHRVRYIQTLDTVDNEQLTGVIHVREGYNCRVRVLSASDTVIVTASRGAGRGIACDADSEDIVSCSDVLLGINGLMADSEGNFLILGGPGVSITANPDEHSLTFNSGLADGDNTRCG